jgi:TRAP-type C4-dicarboxylate transport system permease small subunit
VSSKHSGKNLRKLQFVASLPKVVLYALLGGLTLSVFTEIVQRFIPGVPLYGITEIITLFSAYLYLLAMAYVTYRKRHITVDILHMVVKNESVIRYLELVSFFICIVVCFVYDYLAFQYCYGVAIAKQTTPDIGYPRIFLVSCLALGLTLTCFFFVLYFINAIRLKIIGR